MRLHSTILAFGDQWYFPVRSDRGFSYHFPHLLSIRVHSRCTPPYSGDMNFVGIGYDVHQFAVGRPLFLGGVEIAHSRGLEGHSDADVVMHAICDAVLGALGAGDIGIFFPNTDPRWKGAPSQVFLEEAARQVASRGGQIINVDCTVLAQEPKIAPHVQAMKKRVAEALRIDPARVGIKATTNEKMGFIGRGEGIAAMAVASVEIGE